QPVAARPAQQTMQRQAGRLAGDVPQRDVETRQGEDRYAVAAEQVQLLLQVIGEPGDVARVLAHGDGRDHVVAGGPHGVGAGIAEGLAPADDAVVGFDPHQKDVVGRPGTQAFALVTAAEGVRHLHRMRVDTRDLHSILPLLLMSAKSFSAWAWSARRLEAKRGSPAGAFARRGSAGPGGSGGGSVCSSGISTSACVK